MSIIPPSYDTESIYENVADSERRRYKRDSFISSLIEWLLIILAAGLFIAFLGINLAQMIRGAIHSPFVAALLLFMFLMWLAILRRSKKE